MKVFRYLILCLLIIGSASVGMAVESGIYRLLSISESEKLILVSRNPDKKKFLLDIASAKITLNEKPVELEELSSFSVIRIKWKKSNDKRNGIPLDGVVTEIEIQSPSKTEIP